MSTRSSASIRPTNSADRAIGCFWATTTPTGTGPCGRGCKLHAAVSRRRIATVPQMIVRMPSLQVHLANSVIARNEATRQSPPRCAPAMEIARMPPGSGPGVASLLTLNPVRSRRHFHRHGRASPGHRSWNSAATDGQDKPRHDSNGWLGFLPGRAGGTAAPLAPNIQTRFALDVTFTIMAGLIQGGWADGPCWSFAMTGLSRAIRYALP